MVALNRAVAVPTADGSAAAVELVDAVADGNALVRYRLLPAVRADLLVRLLRPDETRVEFERAAG